jgi:hypothetical protein
MVLILNVRFVGLWIHGFLMWEEEFASTINFSYEEDELI